MTGTTSWPLHLHIARLIRRGIGTGVYPVGSTLPSVEQLARTYEASATVIAAALRELRSEQLLSGRTGEPISVIDEPGTEPSSNLDS